MRAGSPVRLTARGWALAVGGLAAVVVAYLTGWPALLAVGVFLIALVAAGAVLVRLAPARVRVERVVLPPVTEPGMPVDVRIALSGSGAAGAEWRDRVPPGVAVIGRHGGALPHLDPARPVELAYSLVGRRRGAHPIGPFDLDRLDPLGAAVSRRPGGGRTELVVLPEIHPVTPPRVAARVDVDPSVSALVGAAGEQRDIIAREYRVGDGFRHVDWRSTAHRGELMVRSEAAARAVTTALVLDTRASSWGDPAAFEWAISCVASLAAATVSGGGDLRFVVPGGRAPSIDLDDVLLALALVAPDDADSALGDLVGGVRTAEVQVVHLVTGPGAVHQLPHLPHLAGGAAGIVSVVDGRDRRVRPPRGWRLALLDPRRGVQEAWRDDD